MALSYLKQTVGKLSERVQVTIKWIHNRVQATTINTRNSISEENKVGFAENPNNYKGKRSTPVSVVWEACKKAYFLLYLEPLL